MPLSKVMFSLSWVSGHDAAGGSCTCNGLSRGGRCIIAGYRHGLHSILDCAERSCCSVAFAPP